MYRRYRRGVSDKIPVTEARAQFSELVNRVGFGKERIVLTRHGKPLVALVPAEDLAELDDPPITTPVPFTATSSPRARERGSSYLDLAARASDPPNGPLRSQ